MHLGFVQLDFHGEMSKCTEVQWNITMAVSMSAKWRCLPTSGDMLAGGTMVPPAGMAYVDGDTRFA